MLIFWIEDLSLAVAICVFNILLQSFYGTSLIQQLPPGNGSVSKIGILKYEIVHVKFYYNFYNLILAKIFGWNMAMSLIAYIIHFLIQYLLKVLPPDTKLPFQVFVLLKKIY